MAMLGGLPLIVRVVKQARKATILDDVIVATDDQRIADAVKSYGGDAVVTPGRFACGSDRIAFVAKGKRADVVVNIQGDEPMIAPEVIMKVANLLIDNPRAVMSTACSRITSLHDATNPDVVKVVMAKDGRALYFSRGLIPWHDSTMYDSAPVFRHIGIYGFTAEFLQIFASLERTPLEKIEGLEQLRALEHGHNIHCIKTQQVFSGIDSQEDLFRAEKMLENLR